MMNEAEVQAEPPKVLTGAEIVWEVCVAEGVEVVFGYPGGAIMPVYDALLNYPVRHVLVRHEQGAAHRALDPPCELGDPDIVVVTDVWGGGDHFDAVGGSNPRHRE